MNRLLEVNHLTVKFNQHGAFQTVVDDVSFAINEGEILGVVGESGSGKSMSALAIMGLLPEDAYVCGSVKFRGQELIGMSEKECSHFQGNGMGMVFQEPMTSLNPVMKVGYQVGESLLLHKSLSKEEVYQRTIEALKDAGLEDAEKVYDSYPHELSGGMRQRAMIAMAMVSEPQLLIADEPTTALDVLVQSQILKLLKEINKKKKISVLFISHNLNVIREISDHVLVMRRGKVVETGTVEKIFYHMENEYTRQLVETMVQRQEDYSKEEQVLKISNLSVSYKNKGILLWKNKKEKQVLHDLNLDVRRGEIFGIVGESGCGKSTLARVITGLHKDYSGSIEKKDGIRPQMVFQDPFSSLNPAHKIGWIMQEPLRVRGIKEKEKREKMVSEMLKDIGLDDSYMDRKPGELSGGQRQRISIGLALLMGSEFLIADEPVSALDVTIQKQILELLMKINKEKGTAILIITHDLQLVYHVCHRAAVIKDGTIMELEDGRTLCEEPKNEYTKNLLSAAMFARTR